MRRGVLLFLSALTLALVTALGNTLDRDTARAVQACHDHLWQHAKLDEQPGTTVTAYPESRDDDQVRVHWALQHDDNTTSGHCLIGVGSGRIEVLDFQQDSRIAILLKPLLDLQRSFDADPKVLSLTEFLVITACIAVLLSTLLALLHWRFCAMVYDRDSAFEQPNFWAIG